MHFQDTVCAPATPVGAGAISIIRISGSKALEAIDSIASFSKGSAAATGGYTLKRAEIEGLDDVLVAIFHAPHSYTGEDSAEIYCHASTYIANGIMERLVHSGCRIADPGEFTQRAFLNGKMDLAQAEAVADVIASNSQLSLQVARNQLKGGYSAELRQLRSQMLELTALLELELDFSEEDVEFADRSRLRGLLSLAIENVGSLAESFKDGNAIRNGVPVAIVGAVNSGKSTLLNALVGDDRAIVSSIAGTTRDTVEETMTLGGIMYRFIDTAGIRQTSDYVESLGVERSLAALDKASVVLCVVDGSSSKEDQDASVAQVRGRLHGGQEMLLLWNKADLGCTEAPEGSIIISAKNGTGLEELRQRLIEMQGERLAAGRTYVTNLRHYQALKDSLAALRRASESLDAGISSELVAEDLRDAINHLGSITGEITTNDVLGEIFGKFCIGK